VGFIVGDFSIFGSFFAALVGEDVIVLDAMARVGVKLG
jgi:hypothetical protein